MGGSADFFLAKDGIDRKEEDILRLNRVDKNIKLH